MDFTEAEGAYLNLVRRKQAGQLSEAEFSAAVQNLRVQTPDGVWWQIREDGVWLNWDGAAWQESNHRAAQPAELKRKRSPVATCFVLIVVFTCLCVCLLAALGAGGYYAFSSGSLSQRQVLNAVGMGTGEITIVNIADDMLETELVQLDTESGSPETTDRQKINPFEISGYGGIQPGRYELHISATSGVPAGGVCRLTISSGDSFQFVAVPSGIAVTQEGLEVQSADDVDMSTSGLCR